MKSDAAEANFVMKDGYVNPTAREILAIDGAFTYDTSKYKRNVNVVIDTNTTSAEGFDGQFFFHEGAGDKFVFTVDFGTFSADKFAYKHYGGSAVPTVFEVYADGVLLGTGTSTGGNGWLDNWDGYYDVYSDSFAIENPLSGLKTVTIEIVSSSPAWPANNIGYFEFIDTAAYQKAEEGKPDIDFVMEGDSLVISAKKIMWIKDAVKRNPELFDPLGHSIGTNTAGEEMEEYSGMFFIHSGMGDSYTFTVDFGEKLVDCFSYMDYGCGATPTEFELIINGEVVGTGSAMGGNAWELEDYNYANYDEIIFDAPVTGVCTVTVNVIDSEPIWPANNIGMFTFYEQIKKTPTKEPVITEAPASTEVPTQAPTDAPSASKTEKPSSSDKSSGSGKTLIPILITVLEKAAGNGWEFEKVCNVDYSVQGNVLMIEIPLSAIGIDSENFTLNFKWADNTGSDGDIMSFYQNGDAAPLGRFNYCYSTLNKRASDGDKSGSGSDSLLPVIIVIVAVLVALFAALLVLVLIKNKKEGDK